MTEDDILIPCALRFDGYKYAEVTGQELHHIVERAESTPLDQLTEFEQLAAFFALQRYLYKWGGDRLTRRSKVWKLFRELFLRVAHYDTPGQFEEEEYEARWITAYVPRLEECMAVVSTAHASTDYLDEDEVMT